MVNAADYGVPQARPRFVLIGVHSDKIEISFPEPTHGKNNNDSQLTLFENDLLPYVTVEDALSDLPQFEQGEGAEEITQTSLDKKRNHTCYEELFNALVSVHLFFYEFRVKCQS